MNLEPYVRPTATFTAELSKDFTGQFEVKVHWSSNQSSTWTLTLDEIDTLCVILSDALQNSTHTS